MKKLKLKNLYGKSFVNKYVIWICIPLAMLLIGMIFFGIYAGVNKDINKGFNVGIDFAGGSVITAPLGEEQLNSTTGKYKENYDKILNVILSDEIAQKVVDYSIEKNINPNIALANTKASLSYVQKSGTGESMSIIFKYDNISRSYDKNNELTTYRNKLVTEQLKQIYSEDNGFVGVEIVSSNIGATASKNLINTALIATSITFLLILIYIIIRFEVWSGIAAILALFSDIIFMICLTIVFRIQINSSFIAALITIVSYSINNTIVVFDRVRENMKNEKALAGNSWVNNNQIVDRAIWDTMLRSINSTVTTLISILIFAIIGAASIREFALPVIFGLIAGFFSSLCLAPSLYCLMKNASDKAKAKKKGVVKFAGQK
ncbi:MAG: protein translocase subunit SecF [Clostridia bacterium]